MSVEEPEPARSKPSKLRAEVASAASAPTLRLEAQRCDGADSLTMQLLSTCSPETKAAFESCISEVVRSESDEPLRSLAEKLMQCTAVPPEVEPSDLVAQQLLDALHAEPKIRTCKAPPIIGTSLGGGGSLDFYGGQFGRDGKLYLTPRAAGRVVCFDPATGISNDIGDQFVAYDPASQKGMTPDELEKLSWADAKWIGSQLANDGCIYALPGKATRALRINPAQGTATEFGDDCASLASGIEFPWHETVLGGDGNLYGIPLNAPCVLRLDPVTGRATTFGSLEKGGDKYISGILSPTDGCIYCPPGRASRILKIDPQNSTAVCVCDKLEGGGLKYHSGAVAADGNIYCIPGESAGRVLCIVPGKNPTISFIGDELPGGWRFHRGFAGSDGCIYGMSLRHDDEDYRKLLRIDPASNTVAQVGEKQPYLSKRSMCYGAAVAPDGATYLIPMNTPNIPKRVYLPPTGSLLTALLDSHAGELRAAVANDERHRVVILRTIAKLAQGKDAEIDLARRCLELCGTEVAACIENEHVGQNLLMACERACKMPAMLGPSVARLARDVGLRRLMRLTLASAPGRGIVLKGNEKEAGKASRRRFEIVIGAAEDAVTVACLNDGRLFLVANPEGSTKPDDAYGLDLHHAERAPGRNMDFSTWCVHEGKSVHQWDFRDDMTLTNFGGRGVPVGLLVVGANGDLDKFGCIKLVPADEAAREKLRTTTNSGSSGSSVAVSSGAFDMSSKLVFEKNELQGLTPPLPVMRSLLSDVASRKCLASDVMRQTFVRLVVLVLNLGDTNGGGASAEDSERLKVGALARERMPELASAYGTLVFSPLSKATSQTVFEGVALFSLYFAGGASWSPAPDGDAADPLATWLRPAKQPPAVGLLKSISVVEDEGGTAVQAVWPILAPLAIRIVARIVAAVAASEKAQGVLRQFFDHERQGSLENYRAALLRCRREPTYREYVQTSSKLKATLAARSCHQQERSFPRLLQQAASMQEQFIAFVKLLGDRTRAEASLPPAKATRHGEYHCLKSSWRTIEKMALKPGTLPKQIGDVERMTSDELCGLLDSSTIFDILRGSLKCSDFNVIVTVLDLLLDLDKEHQKPNKVGGFDLARFSIRLHRIKCRFTAPTSGGWADMLVNFSFTNDPNAHICELQLQHEMLLVIRKEGKAHEAYAAFRSAFEVLEAIGKPPDDVFSEKLEREEMNPIDRLEEEVSQLRTTNASLEARLAALEKRLGE